MKILSVVGARPNFVKIAPLLAEMRKRPEINPLLVYAGQHYNTEMSASLLLELDVPQPNCRLRARPGSSATQVSAIMRRRNL